MHVMPMIQERSALRARFAKFIFAASAAVVVAASPPTASAETRHFSMTIEDTILKLVDKQTFHTFSFNNQTPGPLIHVQEGDDVEIEVENNTTLPHTIHWHGMFQRGTWKNDGVPDTTQPAIPPGETFTYRFKAE